MTIDLDEASAEIIQHEIDRGAFTDTHEAIARAIRLLADQDDGAWLWKNRGAIQSALKESCRGNQR